MANNVTVQVTTTDNTQAGLNQAESSFRRFGAMAAKGLAAAGTAAGGLLAQGVAANLNISAANDKLAGQLGLSADAAKKAGDTAGSVYRDNFGGSIEEVNDAIKAVGTNLGDVSKMSSKDLKSVTEGALALAGTFNVDVNDATRSASKLISSGLAQNSTQAFDIITKGFQNGLDSSGDFLDTLNEYSPQFKKLGIDGAGALNILKQGLKAGARDTDAIADAFKEFSLRAIDGSKTTADGFKALGMDAKKSADAIAKGGPAAEKTTLQTLTALKKMKDPVQQNAAGVALFGTQWEDTLRSILPKMDLTTDSIGKINGATKNMADTVSGNGKASIEGMKRAFEGWTQKMAGADGPLGNVVAGVVAFGGPALAMAGSVGAMVSGLAALNLSLIGSKIALAATATWTGIVTAAQWAWNAALTANPIGLVIAGIALLVAGLVIAWKKSETFRNVVMDAFDGIKLAGGTMVTFLLKSFKFLLNAWMVVAGGILHGAAKAFGWVPGLGSKLKSADKAFGSLKDGVNSKFDSMINKVNSFDRNVANGMRERHLRADISDWTKKLNSAKARLRSVPASKRAYLRGEIGDLTRKINNAKGQINSIHGKTVTIRVNALFPSNIGNINSGFIPGISRATGGMVGQAATGGMRANQVLVGEHGPEIVDLAPGTRVRSNDSTRTMLNQNNGGAMKVQLEWIGGNGADDLFNFFRKNIRIRGGNVQTVLGT